MRPFTVSTAATCYNLQTTQQGNSLLIAAIKISTYADNSRLSLNQEKNCLFAHILSVLLTSFNMYYTCTLIAN